MSGGDDKDDKDEKKVSTAELFAPANRRAVTIGTGDPLGPCPPAEVEDPGDAGM